MDVDLYALVGELYVKLRAAVRRIADLEAELATARQERENEEGGDVRPG